MGKITPKSYTALQVEHFFLLKNHSKLCKLWCNHENFNARIFVNMLNFTVRTLAISLRKNVENLVKLFPSLNSLLNVIEDSF